MYGKGVHRSERSPPVRQTLYYYTLTLQHPNYLIAPVPVAKMISSDQGTAEITHFLNKWYFYSKIKV